MKSTLAHRYGLLIAGISAVVGACVLLISLYFLDEYSQQTALTGSNQVEEFVFDEKVKDTLVVMEALAATLELPVYNRDFSEILEYIEPFQENEEYFYMMVEDKNGLILHDGTPELIDYNEPFTNIYAVPLLQFDDRQAIINDQQLHFYQPISIGGEEIAYLRAGINYDSANEKIVSITEGLEKENALIRQKISTYSLIAISILLLVTSLIVFMYSRRIFLPIQTLIERCDAYSSGNKDLTFEIHNNTEFGVLGQALESMKRSVEYSQSEIESLAYIDTLTRLPNRRMFNETLELFKEYAEKADFKFALMFIDLDQFKQINDVAGHDVGDKLLSEAAQRLLSQLPELSNLITKPINRRFISRILSRLGGDEFVLIIPEFNEIAEIEAIAKQVNNCLAEPFVINGQRYSVTSSIGITEYPKQAESTKDLLKQADMAMYVAKRAGRNCFRIYDQQMNTNLVERIEIVNGIRDALENNQLYLLYQPILCLKTRRIMGAEALIRWKHPEKGNISPAIFIPIIEQTELIGPITLWVLKRACQSLKDTFLPINPDFKLSVNISSAAMSNHQTCNEISQILNHESFKPGLVHFEITETSMMENIHQCSSLMSDWKKLGADIWIDDFGTGYSSLSYLHQLPIDGLKIDQSFVNDFTTNHKVIESIIGLCQALNLETVSEGIETEEQALFLEHNQSNYGQGYLFSKPIELMEIKRLLERQAENTPAIKSSAL